jgi:mitogen-activated protein kinase kinase kinase
MYMAPEVIRNGAKGRKGSMDIWSLGCCVLEMATGRRPWSHLDNEWAVMFHVATSHPPLPDHTQMSSKGIAFLKKCFTRNSRERPSAVELLRDEWLRGVDQDESGKEYHYEIPPVEASSTADSNTFGPFGGEDEDLASYSDSEDKGRADRSDQQQAEVVEILIDGDTSRTEHRTLEISKDNLTVNGFADSREADETGGSKSPASCESVSDTASEVGSEVGFIMSAVQKRMENSRLVNGNDK